MNHFRDWVGSGRFPKVGACGVVVVRSRVGLGTSGDLYGLAQNPFGPRKTYIRPHRYPG